MFFNYQLPPFPVHNYVLSTLITIQWIIKYLSEEYFADINLENTGTYKSIRQLFYFSFLTPILYITHKISHISVISFQIYTLRFNINCPILSYNLNCLSNAILYRLPDAEKLRFFSHLNFLPIFSASRLTELLFVLFVVFTIS